MQKALYTAYLEGSLCLSSEGVWRHNGKDFENGNLSEFFHRSIVWDKERSKYKLAIGKEEAFFTVEDTAYFIRWMNDEALPWKLGLNTGEVCAFDEKSLAIEADFQRVYCTVKETHRAKFLRAAHQTLVRHINEASELEVGDARIALAVRS